MLESIIIAFYTNQYMSSAMDKTYLTIHTNFVAINDEVEAAPVSEMPNNTAYPLISIYSERDFNGNMYTVNFGYAYVGSQWDNKISSIRITHGSFEFFGGRNYDKEGWEPVRLGAGHYAWLPDYGIPDKSISSIKAFFGPAKDPLDYITVTTKNPLPHSTCVPYGGEDRLINRHPTRDILVTYFRNDSRILYSQTVKANSYSGVGCSVGDVYKFGYDSRFL